MAAITLQPFTSEHFDDLIGWIDSPGLMQEWAGGLFKFPLSHRSLRWYVRGVNVKGTSQAFVFRIADAETGQTVGHASLGGISYKNNSARITRILVGKEFQGKGYCRETIKALIEYGFAELDLHRIELGVYTHKPNAIKCYENAGMKPEGVMREILKVGDGYWSMLEMSILRQEWEGGKV